MQSWCLYILWLSMKRRMSFCFLFKWAWYAICFDFNRFNQSGDSQLQLGVIVSNICQLTLSGRYVANHKLPLASLIISSIGHQWSSLYTSRVLWNIWHHVVFLVSFLWQLLLLEGLEVTLTKSLCKHESIMLTLFVFCSQKVWQCSTAPPHLCAPFILNHMDTQTQTYAHAHTQTYTRTHSHTHPQTLHFPDQGLEYMVSIF